MAILPLSPLRTGIVYGNCVFSEPMRFPSLLAPVSCGIYAILVRDPNYSPRPFRLLYLGESGTLSQRLTMQHEKYRDWIRQAHGGELYFAHHVTFGLTDQQRKDLECALINQYRPPCNERLSSLVSLLSNTIR